MPISTSAGDHAKVCEILVAHHTPVLQGLTAPTMHMMLPRSRIKLS